MGAIGMRLRWLLTALVLSVLLSVAEYFAILNSLYWKMVWFDVPMHFLGGVTIAVFLVALLMHFRPRLFLLGVFGISVLWEVFEYLAGFPREANYRFDTSLDLLMDALGALFVYVIARVSDWKPKKHE